MTVDIGQEFETANIETVVEKYADDYNVAVSEGTKAVIKFQHIESENLDENEVRQNMVDDIAAQYPGAQLEDQAKVGAIASSELMRNAFISVLIACVFRITSYNVCYTKLLRLWNLPKSWRKPVLHVSLCTAGTEASFIQGKPTWIL